LIIGSTEYRRVAGFIRFVAFFGVLILVLALVVLPLVAGPILTGMVRDMGLRSDTLRVSVELFDPMLVVGRPRAVHVVASGVDLSPAGIGSFELTLGGVSLFDRTWQTVDGELRDISVTTGGERFNVGSVRVTGDAAAAQATARLSAPEIEALIRYTARREGLPLDDVQLTSAGIRVTINGIEGSGRLEVRGGALVLIPGTGTGGIPLLQPAPSDAWQLEEAWISDDAVNVRGVVDTTSLARQVIRSSGSAAAP
jgi:hypothetical protein